MKQQAQWLQLLLGLTRKPVGIKFLLHKEEFDAFEAQAPKNRMSYCTVVRRAGEGRCQKIHRGHSACMGGAMALGLEKPGPDVISGRRRYLQGAYQDLTVAHKVSKGMVYCQHETYGLAVMPLEAFQTEPDVVILILNAYQGMRVAQGYAYQGGHVRGTSFAGMQAICQECTSYPYENDCLNLSLMCSGTRMLAGWKEDELAVGMPYHLLPQVIQGLKQTVNPLVRDSKKRELAQGLEQAGLQDALDIHYHHNYDDGAYLGGPAELPSEA